MNRLLTPLRLLLLAFLALLLTGLALPAVTISAALGGTLTGKVTMKTMGAALPTTPLTVTLLFYNPGYFRINDESVDFKETQTAPDGSFTFAGLDTSPSGVYRVVVRYRGVAYEPAQRDFTDPNGATGKTNAVRFEMGSQTATVEVPIAEPVAGTYGTGFSVVSHSLVINEVRPQFYSIVEAYQIKNDTDRTLVGSVKPDGTAGDGVPIVFSTPAGATEITTSRTDLLATGTLTGQKLTLYTPITPGTTDVTAAYSLQGGSAGITIKRTLDYAAAKVQVLVSDTRQPIDSGMLLRPDPPIQAGGTVSFRPFSAENVMPGQELQLLIGPSPPAVTPTPAGGSSQTPLDRVRSGVSSPALLALAALCFVLMIVVLRWPTRGKAASAKKGGDTPAPKPTKSETANPAPAILRRGRPHDAYVDDAEREIEAANDEGASDQPDDVPDAGDADSTTGAAAPTPAAPAKPTARRSPPRRSRR